MLQRKQTIFLLISTIALAIIFFFPIALFLSEFEIYKLYACRIENLIPTEDSVFSVFFMIPLTVLIVISVILNIVTIANFKKRLYQMQLIRVNVLIVVIINMGIFFIYPFLIEKEISTAASFEEGAYLPLISLVFLIIANRFILKDEKLIKSIDRIR